MINWSIFENIGLTIPGNWSFEIRRISPVKSSRFHPWNLADFTLEIHWISPRYHVKSTQNLITAKTLQFDECRVGAMTKDFMKSARFHVKSARFHEIRRISKLWAFVWWSSIGLLFFERPNHSWQLVFWNPADFTLEIWWISPMKSSGFHPEIQWISPVKYGRFHPDITCEIHPKL